MQLLTLIFVSRLYEREGSQVNCCIMLKSLAQQEMNKSITRQVLIKIQIPLTQKVK